MTEPMRDRLLEACDPVIPNGDLYAPEILARVLAVLADPDDETVEAVLDVLPVRLEPPAARAALAALVAHLTGEAS